MAEKADVGVDLSFFGKLKIQADVFKEHRSGIFLSRKSLPYYSGISVTPYVNMGEMDNSGFDLAADYHHKIGEVMVTGKGTYTFARNVLVNCDEAAYEYPYLNSTGQAYWQPFGYVSDGLFQNQAEIDAHADQSLFNPQPGDIRYVDLNNDGVINTNDRKAIGYRDIPEIYYGFGASVEWRGLDFAVFFKGVDHVSLNMISQAKLLMTGITSTDGRPETSNMISDLYGNYWTPERPNAKYPRLTYLNESTNNTQVSDFWTRDASYISLQNVELGWTLPAKWTSRMRMSAFRVYLQGQNLLRFSKFDLWDPNLTGSGGATVFSYPTTRVISFGISASF